MLSKRPPTTHRSAQQSPGSSTIFCASAIKPLTRRIFTFLPANRQTSQTRIELAGKKNIFHLQDEKNCLFLLIRSVLSAFTAEASRTIGGTLSQGGGLLRFDLARSSRSGTKTEEASSASRSCVENSPLYSCEDQQERLLS
jgi:hypothetical protein